MKRYMRCWNPQTPSSAVVETRNARDNAVDAVDIQGRSITPCVIKSMPPADPPPVDELSCSNETLHEMLKPTDSQQCCSRDENARDNAVDAVDIQGRSITPCVIKSMPPADPPPVDELSCSNETLHEMLEPTDSQQCCSRDENARDNAVDAVDIQGRSITPCVIKSMPPADPPPVDELSCSNETLHEMLEPTDSQQCCSRDENARDNAVDAVDIQGRSITPCVIKSMPPADPPPVDELSCSNETLHEMLEPTDSQQCCSRDENARDNAVDAVDIQGRSITPCVIKSMPPADPPPVDELSCSNETLHEMLEPTDSQQCCSRDENARDNAVDAVDIQGRSITPCVIKSMPPADPPPVDELSCSNETLHEMLEPTDSQQCCSRDENARDNAVDAVDIQGRSITPCVIKSMPPSDPPSLDELLGCSNGGLDELLNSTDSQHCRTLLRQLLMNSSEVCNMQAPDVGGFSRLQESSSNGISKGLLWRHSGGNEVQKTIEDANESAIEESHVNQPCTSQMTTYPHEKAQVTGQKTRGSFS